MCNDMQNCAQMKESKCAKDVLKCANEKRWFEMTKNLLFILVLLG